ncbi:hypothetical protein, partial [Chryseobacterium sp. HMWF001]
MKYIAFFLFLFSIDLYAQNTDDSYYLSIITDINNYELKNALGKTEKLKEQDYKTLFQNEINYLKTGMVSNAILSLNTSKFDYYLKGIYYVYLGDYYSRISNKFSKKSFKWYLKTYQLGIRYHNTSLKQESIRRILHQFQFNEMNFIQFSEYSDQYLGLKNDTINTFWSKYYSAFKLYYEKTEYNKKNSFTIKNYDSLLIYSQQKPFLKGRVYQ